MPTETFVNSLPLGEWGNNFYDPKLILKHIIWIHFYDVHSVNSTRERTQMCVAKAPYMARQKLFFLSLCLSYATNVYGI